MISIVIPSWQRPRDLIRALDNIQETTRRFEVEPVVVLNHDDAASREAVEGSRATVVTMPQGMPGGRPHRCWQAGYEAACGEWVVQSADDAVFDPGWLGAAMSCPNRGFIVLYDQFRQGNLPTHWMATREYIEKVMGGYFGLSYYYCYWSDNEIMIRAQQAGSYVVCPKASVVHLNRALIGESFEEDAYTSIAGQYYGPDQITFKARLAAGFPVDWPTV